MVGDLTTFMPNKNNYPTIDKIIMIRSNVKSDFNP
jgi:hypothetical protein